MSFSNDLASVRTKQYPLGPLLKEGTHRRVLEVKGHPDLVIIAEKNDGKEMNRILAERATELQCDALDLLLEEGVSVAFVTRDTASSFIARKCKILPCKIAVRCEAYGRYLQRHPEHSKGHNLIHPPAAELFLRTADRRWKERELAHDQPLIKFAQRNQIVFFHPTQPVEQQLPFLSLNETEIFPTEGTQLVGDMTLLAFRALKVLERRWKNTDHRLVGFTAECGLTPEGEMLLTDLVVNDDL